VRVSIHNGKELPVLLHHGPAKRPRPMCASATSCPMSDLSPAPPRPPRARAHAGRVQVRTRAEMVAIARGHGRGSLRPQDRLNKVDRTRVPMTHDADPNPLERGWSVQSGYDCRRDR
jgi:hypothetical protein